MFHTFKLSIFRSSFIHQAARCFNNHGSHMMLEFREMNSVFEGIFWVLLFRKYFLGFSVSGKVFLGPSEIPNTTDSCL